jgi:cation diffusion facilitator CzcD-associated flavoprotein CzcO
MIENSAVPFERNDAAASSAASQTPGTQKGVVDVLVIGGGFAGLCMAIRLRQRGLSFVVLERAGEIGGTWQANTYPGCSCDIPSQLYSYSFELNADWKRTYPPQSEILAYLKRCAEKYLLPGSILLSTEAREAVFDETDKVWLIRTQHGQTIAARAVVSATGPLSRPFTPKLPGIERFKGKTFHSSEWDHSLDLSGKKVAVIGTGASAIQFIPQIAPQVEKLAVFQRSPAWILPKLDVEHANWVYPMLRYIPGCKRLIRSILFWCQEAVGVGLVNPKLVRPLQWFASLHIYRKVSDPELRKALTPTYTIGCKRILLSNDYYQSFSRANVELITDEIEEVRGEGIVTQDRSVRPFDVIIFATGFQGGYLLSPLRVMGRNRAELQERWRDYPGAFLGMTVPGFPNFFVLVGPNTFLANNSVVFMIEAQVHYVLKCLRWLQKSGHSAMDVRQDVQDRFAGELQEHMQGTAWLSGCTSWYLDRHGENVRLWPGSAARYWLRTRRFSPDDYLCTS